MVVVRATIRAAALFATLKRADDGFAVGIECAFLNVELREGYAFY
jgi:hypothetical protein